MSSKREKAASEQLANRIAKLRKAIRKKYKRFKTGETEAEIKLEKQYKPLVSELKKNVTNKRIKVEQEPQIKTEEEEGDDDAFEPPVFSSPMNERTLQREQVFGDDTIPDDRDLSSILQSSQGRETASRYIDQNFSNDLTKVYMRMLMGSVSKGRSDPIDHTYGPYFDNDSLKVGDSLLQFDEDGSIRIRDIKYKGTEGLYELLFKRLPDDTLYGESDLTAYKDILVKTNAHKKNYAPEGIVNRNNSLKYRGVISTLFPPRQRQQFFSGTGASLLSKTLSGPDHVYWNDPNELVDRLRLLVASAQAGNTGVKNEILNILEELREAGLISGEGNRAFKLLLR